MDFEFPVLVGDIGGTNARFAIVKDAKSPAIPLDPVRLADFPSIEVALRDAVISRTSLVPRTMMLAIATPLVGSTYRLTNADWVIDPAAMIAAFALERLVLMNDFAAQGLAATALKGEHLAAIGRGRALDNHARVAIGPGTGLGIALILPVNGKWAVIPGEGGHIDLGPRTAEEVSIWEHLKKENGRMSAENALSGRGLENLYQAIVAWHGGTQTSLAASEISARALSGNDPAAREAAELFLTLLARVAGDMALLTLAHGGIYIAGGIASKMLPMIDHARFRANFEDKAPHQAILKSIPINIITHPTAALEGLAAFVRDPDLFSLESAIRTFTPGS
ncbi:MAG: glucokinase [Rhizobiaceae bacterium]